MAKKVSIENITAELSAGIAAYAADVSEKIEKAVDDHTEKMRIQLSGTSPRKTGTYAGDWTRKVSHSAGRTYGTVYQGGEEYRLTWLLESGHKARNWEMNHRTVRAIPHITPVQNDIRKELDQIIKDILE